MQIAVSDTEDRYTIALMGDLDTSAAHELDIQLEAIIPHLNGELTIDLSNLSYLNSTGIRSFIRLDKQLKPLGQHFVFVNAAPRLLRIFQYCGLDTYFVFQSKTAAPQSGPH